MDGGALPGYFSHVIDLHAQAPIFFLLPLPLVSHSAYPSRRVPPLYSLKRLAIALHTQVKEREDKCVLIERHAEGSGGLPVWVFSSTRRDIGEEWRRHLLRPSLLFVSLAVRTWPLTDILSTHKRIQWYTRVTVDPQTGCHCMRRSQ